MKTFLVVRDSLGQPQYYHWSDADNDVVWQDSPSKTTRWTRHADAEVVAQLYKDARVIRRVD